MDLKKSRKYINRKKWVTVSTLAITSASLFAINNDKVMADVNHESKNENVTTEKNLEINQKNNISKNEEVNTNSTELSPQKTNDISKDMGESKKVNSKESENTFENNKTVVKSNNENQKQIVPSNEEVRKAYIGVFAEPTKLEHVSGADEYTYKFNNLNKISQIDIKYNINENKNNIDPNPGNQYPIDFLKYEKLDNGAVKVTVNSDYEINGQTYEFDDSFGQAMDSERLNSNLNNDSVIFDKNSDAYIFNLSKLTGSMATTAAGPGEGYQLFVKVKGQNSASDILQAQHKHSNEAMVNWYSQDDGSYIGSTIFDDYSMGAGYKELSRAYDVQYGHNPSREELDNYVPDPLLANVEDTKYWVKTYNNTNFYYDRSGVWDGTYNDDISKGELGGMPVINADNTEAVFDSGFHSLDLNNGKVFNIFRAHISLNGANPNDTKYIPRIYKLTGYTSEDKVPYFVNYHYGEDGNDKTYIASFVGKLGSSNINVANNIQGQFLGNKLYPDYNLQNAVKLPVGYTFQNFNFDTHDSGTPVCETWQAQTEFNPDVTQEEFVNENLNRKYEISKEDDWAWVAPEIKVRLIDKNSNQIISEKNIIFDKSSGLVVLSKSNLSADYGGFTRTSDGQYGASRMPYYLINNFAQLNQKCNIVPDNYVIDNDPNLFRIVKYKNYKNDFAILNNQIDVLVSQKSVPTVVTNTFRYMDGDKQVGQDIVAWGDAKAYLSTANYKKLSTLPAGYQLAAGETIPTTLSDKTEIRVINIKKNTQFDEIKSELDAIGFKGNASIYKDGKNVLNYTTANNSNTSYLINSVQKPFTSTLLMLAVKDKKINLDDKLSKYYPNISNSDKISIMQLLEMKSGLKYTGKSYSTDPFISDEKNIEYDSKYITFNPLKYNNWDYEDINYIILSHILEKVENDSYQNLFKKNFIDKLSLKESGFALDPSSELEKINFVKEKQNNIDMLDMHGSIGAAGVIMSNDDLYKTLSAILSDDYLNSSDRNTIFNLSNVNGNYRGGFYNYHGFLASNGGGYHYNTFVRISKDGKNAIIMQTNSGHSWSKESSVAYKIYHQMFK